jgi:hypothetical protein
VGPPLLLILASQQPHPAIPAELLLGLGLQQAPAEKQAPLLRVLPQPTEVLADPKKGTPQRRIKR